MNLINLTSTQRILFISAMMAIIVQLFCIFCFLDKNQEFNFTYCVGYLIFSAVAYICYYKLVIT